MKKLYILVIMLMMFPMVSYGAVSEDIYVRQDVFDARMDRLEMMLEKSIIEVRGDINVINTRLNALDNRISDLQTFVYWVFGVLGLIISFAAISPSLGVLLKKVRRPSLTVEDVERIVYGILEKK